MVTAALWLALSLGTLPRQDLAPGECAIFLWRGDPRPALLLVARGGSARIALGSGVRDLARADGADPSKPATSARYADTTLSVSIDLVLEEREGLVKGALVRDGTVSVAEAGGDTVVQPVGGLLACR